MLRDDAAIVAVQATMVSTKVWSHTKKSKGRFLRHFGQLIEKEGFGTHINTSGKVLGGAGGGQKQAAIKAGVPRLEPKLKPSLPQVPCLTTPWLIPGTQHA